MEVLSPTFMNSVRPAPWPGSGIGRPNVNVGLPDKSVPNVIAWPDKASTSACENGEKRILPPGIGLSFVSNPADSRLPPDGSGSVRVRDWPPTGSAEVIWNENASWQV